MSQIVSDYLFFITVSASNSGLSALLISLTGTANALPGRYSVDRLVTVKIVRIQLPTQTSG